MGAVANMRPDLFKAVVSKVPFVDVINTMLDASLPLTVGEYEEWGNPQKKEEYDYMKTLLPLHEPASAGLPGDAGEDVVQRQPGDVLGAGQVRGQAAHAEDRRATRCSSRRTWRPGHGGASGRYDFLREVAFDYAFILAQLGIAR